MGPSVSTTSGTEAVAAVAVLGEVTSSGMARDQARFHSAARSLVAVVKRQLHIGLCRGQIVALAVEHTATLVAGGAIATPESSKTTEMRVPTVLPGSNRAALGEVERDSRNAPRVARHLIVRFRSCRE